MCVVYVCARAFWYYLYLATYLYLACTRDLYSCFQRLSLLFKSLCHWIHRSGLPFLCSHFVSKPALVLSHVHMIYVNSLIISRVHQRNYLILRWCLALQFYAFSHSRVHIIVCTLHIEITLIYLCVMALLWLSNQWRKGKEIPCFR